MKSRPGVTDVQFNQDWVERMQGFSRLASAIGVFLGGILVLASFFIISNVIKLNVMARRNEIEILRLMAAGANTKVLAERLHVSPATVRNHAQNIFAKLDVHSRLEAVAWANQHGLV